MYIIEILLFLCICCLGVFFFVQLKEKEDDIEELYNMYYEIGKNIHLKNEEEEKIKNKKIERKGRLYYIDKYDI